MRTSGLEVEKANPGALAAQSVVREEVRAGATIQHLPVDMQMLVSLLSEAAPGCQREKTSSFRTQPLG